MNENFSKQIFGDSIPKTKTKEELRELVNQIKNSSFEEISILGDKETKSCENFANHILENTKGGEVQEINNIISNVVRVCKQDYRKRKNIFSKLIGAANEKISDIKRHYSSIQEHLNVLVEEVQNKKIQTIESRKNIENMLVQISNDYYVIYDYLEAVKIAKSEYEAEIEISEEDKMMALVMSEGKSFMLELLNQKIDDLTINLEAIRQSTLQILREIANAKRVELRLNTIEDRTVKLWKNGIVLYINSLKLKDTINLTNAIHEATNMLWIDNAEQIAENSREVFKVSSKSLLSIEAVEKVNEIIENNLIEIKKINDENIKDRAKNYLRLEKMSNSSARLSLSSKKAI